MFRKIFRSIGSAVFAAVLVSPSAAQYSVESWGNDWSGQLGIGNWQVSSNSPQLVESVPPAEGRFVSIVPGGNFTLGIREDGSLWGWGHGPSYQLGNGDNKTAVLTPKLSHTGAGREGKWIKVASGYHSLIGLRENGSLWGWGSVVSLGPIVPGTGQYAMTPTLMDNKNQYIEAAAYGPSASTGGGGPASFAVIRADGTLLTWGLNTKGMLGNGTAGGHRMAPVLGNHPEGWSKVAIGSGFMVAIKKDGSLWSWGSNSVYALGLGSLYTEVAQPTLADAGSAATGGRWIDISAGTYHLLALREDSSLWAWGHNLYGQTGDGTINNVEYPKKISSDKWVRISTGAYHSLAMKADSSLWGWGRNNKGQLGDGTNQDGVANQVPRHLSWLGKVDISSSFLVSGMGSEHSFLMQDIPILPPVCLTPMVKLNRTGPNSYTFSWPGNPGAPRFEMALDQTPGTAPSGPVTVITDTFFHANNLNFGQTYYFHIRTLCASGTSIWTVTSVYVPERCEEVDTINTEVVTSTGAHIRWSKVRGALRYDIALDGAAALPPSGQVLSTVDTFFFAAFLEPEQRYIFHVRSDCGDNNYSDWDTISLRTLPACGPDLNPSAAPAGSGIVKVEWSEFPQATGYEFAVDQSPATAPTGSTVILNRPEYRLSNLKEGELYYAHVRAICPDFDYGPWDTVSFVAGAQPGNVSDYEPYTRIRIWPNPVKDKLYFQTDETLHVRLFRIDGKMLLSREVHQEMSLSGLSSGMMILAIYSADGRMLQQERILKE